MARRRVREEAVNDTRKFFLHLFRSWVVTKRDCFRGGESAPAFPDEIAFGSFAHAPPWYRYLAAQCSQHDGIPGVVRWRRLPDDAPLPCWAGDEPVCLDHGRIIGRRHRLLVSG